MIGLADAAATDAWGRRLAACLRGGDVVTLSGKLGAGKTSFARGVLAGLGWAGEVASPSFALAIPYEPPALRLPVLHADLYRLRAPGELEELGLDEWAADGVLLVEWPEQAGKEAFPAALRLTIAAEAGGGRRLTAEVPPAWEGRWPPR